MNGPISKGVSSAFPRVFSRRSAILKIVEEKALGTRLGQRSWFSVLTKRIAASGDKNAVGHARTKDSCVGQAFCQLLSSTSIDRVFLNPCVFSRRCTVLWQARVFISPCLLLTRSIVSSASSSIDQSMLVFSTKSINQHDLSILLPRFWKRDEAGLVRNRL